MDLIAGLTGDTLDSFCKTLESVTALEPENITVHSLTMKRAADMIGARTFHLQEIEVQPRTETKQDQTFTPEENWIAQNDDWLGG